MPASDNNVSLRIDKWLWAARFYKTRGIAADAVKRNKVQLNEARTKPSHAVKTGDQLTIRREREEMTIIVAAISPNRRPAREAQLLYSETEESRSQRELASEQRRLLTAAIPTPDRRPGKRERRQIRQFTGKDD